MRFAYFLLVATATVLSSCNVIALTSVEDQAKVPLVSAADAAVSVRALDISHGKRFLRSYDENDEDAEYEEERGVMNAAQIEKWHEKAKEWVSSGLSPGQVRDILTGLKGGMHTKNQEKFKLFMDLWNKKNREVLEHF
ncbi:hypothetical protein F443_13709 [Phytophthora nicotianae P1569]|uniref:RxLR effector protein n=2 Tax=Phytophthora nicotianae TaxID=4792 RepID=V9EQ55_PHYNI|nr:hypothetical protein F443_13709 [Phytophthora nicotianae P1569]ETO69691.1 hypothetical protein F444_13765 [Phytophthora nicotianae P1976]